MLNAKRMVMYIVLVGCILGFSLSVPAEIPAPIAVALERNAVFVQEAVRFCLRYASGWLSHADPESGLLPRNLTKDVYWNAKDAAADNFPFLALTAEISGLSFLRQAANYIFDQERCLTTRKNSLPDDYNFVKQNLSLTAPKLSDQIFGASEYVKDGLIPLCEWEGPGIWLGRMQELIRAIYSEAERTMPSQTIPSTDIEVCGELMQSMSRLYWITKDPWYKERCFDLANYFLFDEPLVQRSSLRLKDHGCEIIGGLSEVYVIAAQEDPPLHSRYRPAIHTLLDAILDKGTNELGMMPEGFNPQTGEWLGSGPNDNWGYVYNAFLTVAEVDNIEKYRGAVRHALTNIHKHLGVSWDGGSADGYADSVEGALNLLNRLPVPSAFEWVEQSLWHIFAKQREDGIIEGWHGDGNGVRTAWMVALWKTQGATVQPWREDIYFGAARDETGALYLVLRADWKWRGILKLDRPRHTDHLGIPLDYPRINQFPEWFVALENERYEVGIDQEPVRTMAGKDLWGMPLELEAGQTRLITIRPTRANVPSATPVERWRSFAYHLRGEEPVDVWQNQLRQELARVLKIHDDEKRRETPLEPILVESTAREGYFLYEVEFSSAPNRRIRAVHTLPKNKNAAPFPAVVCIHGHGGTRYSVYNEETPYKRFAHVLATSGVGTISIDVGQHTVFDPATTLMGERLMDLMRAVDYLESLDAIDKNRIGCAGLSLGGEMAMWLGAMDRRMRTVVSSGFLTVMNQMELNHCMCWKEEGLREIADFPDIYGLIAPRALLCQIGRQEPLSQFNVVLAERAFSQLQKTYADLEASDKAVLDIHAGGHEINVSRLCAFLLGHL